MRISQLDVPYEREMAFYAGDRSCPRPASHRGDTAGAGPVRGGRRPDLSYRHLPGRVAGRPHDGPRRSHLQQPRGNPGPGLRGDRPPQRGHRCPAGDLPGRPVVRDHGPGDPGSRRDEDLQLHGRFQLYRQDQRDRHLRAPGEVLFGFHGAGHPGARGLVGLRAVAEIDAVHHRPAHRATVADHPGHRDGRDAGDGPQRPLRRG